MFIVVKDYLVFLRPRAGVLGAALTLALVAVGLTGLGAARVFMAAGVLTGVVAGASSMSSVPLPSILKVKLPLMSVLK